MDYQPEKETASQRQVTNHADFTYSLSGHVITIVDLNLGNRSVTNDIQYVLRQIEQPSATPVKPSPGTAMIAETGQCTERVEAFEGIVEPEWP
jgi:hypothetical protein